MVFIFINEETDRNIGCVFFFYDYFRGGATTSNLLTFNLLTLYHLPTTNFTSLIPVFVSTCAM